MKKKLTDSEFEEKLKSLCKSFGDGYDKRGLADAEYKAIPTGHDDLDCLLTKDALGVYLGGIIELFGGTGGGKTSLALCMVKQAQSLGYHCCWIDAEAGFSHDLALVNGVDLDRLVMPSLIKKGKNEDDIKIMNAAEVIDMAFQSIWSGAFGLVVLDSVAGLSPERVVQDGFDPNSMGMSEKARTLSEILPKVAHACEAKEASLILINQLRDKPGNFYPDRYHTPGGHAKNFLAQQRISVEKIKGKDGQVVIINDDGQEEVIGHYARVKIIKNKKAPPVPEGIPIHIPIYYRHYDPDTAKKCYDLARRLQVITMRQGILTWKEGDKIYWKLEGENAVLNRIRKDQSEGRLSLSCVKSAASERNQKLKHPIRVPHSIQEMAKSCADDVKLDDKK